MLHPHKLIFTVLICLLSVIALPKNSVNSQPGAVNIIVIMTDDLSKDLFDGLVSNDWMPNLKTHLIDYGVLFENSFVTNALCCPSRATFLTGQYSHNHKVISNKSFPLKPGIASPGWFPTSETPGRNESTIATSLEGAGYHTGFIGKYLNGYGKYAPYSESDPKTYIPPGGKIGRGSLIQQPTGFMIIN